VPHCNEVLPFILCRSAKKKSGEKPLLLWVWESIAVEAEETDLSERKLCSDGIVSGPSMKREFVIYVENHIVENPFDRPAFFLEEGLNLMDLLSKSL